MPLGDDETIRSFGPSRFLNRELSWLEFSARVLALAEDPALPLLERVKFTAIFCTNLDEFFQVRVGALHEQLRAGVAVKSFDGRTASAQCDEIRARVLQLLERKRAVFTQQLLPQLALAGIRLATWKDLDEPARAVASEYFASHVEPVLTPLSVDRAHPFPAISNLSLNLAVWLENPENAAVAFARVKVPATLPRFVKLGQGEPLLPIEELIGAKLDRLFPGMRILERHPFRVTLDADLELDEGEADDLLEAVAEGLQRRLRMNHPVRLETAHTMPADMRELLLENLELNALDVYDFEGLTDLGDLWELYDLARPEHKFTTERSVQPLALRGEEPDRAADFFEVLRREDVLVHHPYESFRGSVEEFIWQAARDPSVLAIKHTLYRTSGRENPVVLALCHAAQAGKQVAVVIELRARFDEQANIERAQLLERAGAHVVYGVIGLKTHAKLALVVRQEPDGLRRYCHIGTGNYNPITARIYEDLGLFTASPEIASDVAALFNYLTGLSRTPIYERLLVAPHNLVPRLQELIEAEMREPDGHVVAKVNGVQDPATIDALCEASRAGVRVELFVRGICCLRPGALGLSERITVRSILGRYLEHSRVFRFGSERRGHRYFIGSADLMTRNLWQRVEALVPITAPEHMRRLDALIAAARLDDEHAWELDQDGTWHRIEKRAGASLQRALHDAARSHDAR
ncbi:MAG TPA: polyphosphate kinase 1 [Myxococcota bacterium]